MSGAFEFDRRDERTLPPLQSIFSEYSSSDPPYRRQPDTPYSSYTPEPRPQNAYPPPPAPPPSSLDRTGPHPSRREFPSLHIPSSDRPEPYNVAPGGHRGYTSAYPPSTPTSHPLPQPPHQGSRYEQEPLSYHSGSAEPFPGRSPGDAVTNHSASSQEGSSSKAAPPAVVGVKNIPGEGECYILEDGSRMKTTIAGERVNPAWGITKAGKPRKRLAQACVTCREKKIKCEQGDPRDPKCGQCSRLNRVCKKPQETRSSPEPDGIVLTSVRPMHDPYHAPTSLAPPPPPPPPQRPETSTAHEQISRKRAFGEMSKPVMSHAGAPLFAASKAETRPRYFQDLPVEADQAAPMPKKRGKQAVRAKSFWGPEGPDEIRTNGFEWGVDPYDVDPTATLYLVGLYFYHRASGPYMFLPEAQFLDWIRNCTTKNEDDRMALYAFMALGAMFSEAPHLKAAADHLGRIATQAESDRSGSHTLQLAHTRTTLLLYYFSRSDWGKAYEYTGSAIMACKALRYHEEDSVRQIDENATTHEYGLSSIQLIECRRRTFWVIYMVDRYNAFSYGSMGFCHDVEIFLGLPAHEDDFLAGREVDTPRFHGDNIREPHTSMPGAMALLVDLTSIWGEVTSHAYRAKNRSEVKYKSFYLKYYEQTTQRLRDWEASVPDHLKYSPENTTRSIQEEYFGDYFVLHALACVIGMKLGRIGRFELLDDEINRRNIQVAMYFARRLLTIVTSLSRMIFLPHGRDIDFALSQPFPGYAMLSACDILSSGSNVGSLASLNNNQLGDAKSVIQQLCRYWAQSKRQYSAIDNLQSLLSAHTMSGDNESRRLRMTNAVEKSFLPDSHDILYGVPDELFYDAVLSIDVDVDPNTSISPRKGSSPK